ncbi:MAG: hypothetical protein LAP87_22105 [Acidobacteriia bacterium]|nr:hypothetical protein [Terriglobia bacterium]
MIAAVKGWHAAFSALLFFIPPAASAADDLPGAARELARKSAAFAGRGGAVSVAWRNLSSLGSYELGQARAAFEAALQESGLRAGEAAPAAELRVTLSENSLQYLLVEEARKGDERQVWMAAWKRTGPAAVPSPAIALDKALLWEQDEPILDVAFPAAAMLVLSASRVALYARENGQWAERQALPLAPIKPWPRDLRGRLRTHGPSFQAYLPGMACSGQAEPALTLECRPSDEPWVLESGSRAMLLANFSAARNYFDGRITTQTGLRKTIPAFYSAASVEEQGRPLWLVAMVDGRTQIFDASFEAAGGIPGWGSDLAGPDARCGGGSPVLATRPGDASEPDAIQAFAVANRAVRPLSAPADLPGPVTALWPSGAAAVLAVARNLATGKYAAYLVTINCGQ